MRIGNFQPFEHALHTAVFAPATVQRIKGNIGRNLGKTRTQVRTRVQFYDFKSCLPQSGGAFAPRGQ